MSTAGTAARRGAEDLTRQLEAVLVERQRIIECGAALTATGRCCEPAHTPARLAQELAGVLTRQKTLLDQLQEVLPPETTTVESLS
jgi:hypothetical protein